jgi:hypothetical protein
MHYAGIMLAAFQFFRHMHDAGSDKGIDQVSLRPLPYKVAKQK